MKKLTLLAALLMLLQVSFAGGILTNTNQSAQFIRMLSRNASLDTDAVYFNPAGLTKLNDGWHFAFHSQTIFQEKTVDSRFPLLNDGNYEGVTNVPIFPTAFAVYKTNDWAFSFGFGPNAGGGSAEFDRGLPSFEVPITKVVPALAGLGVSGYDADIAFEGSSIYWGIQLGATYQVNDILSVYGGVRYLPSKNSYQGAIENIRLRVDGQSIGAASWLKSTAATVSDYATQATGGAAQYAAAATTATGLSGQISAAIAGGLMAGSEPLSDPQLIGALQQYGVDPTGYTNSIAAAAFSQVATTLTGEADKLTATAQELTGTAATLTGTAAQLGNKEVDTEQVGAGFTPMIGVNISPNEDWNIGLKYEMKTILELENNTVVDDLGLFPDGGVKNYDIPGILGVGIGFRGLDWLEAQLSYTMYFNKDVDWGVNTRDNAVGKTTVREIENNGYEIGLGLQFNIADNFAFSVGGMYGDMGVANSYQSDFSYSNPSFTPAAGIMWKVTDALTLDVGVLNAFYTEQNVNFTDPDVGGYTETLDKNTLTFAAGLSYSIF